MVKSDTVIITEREDELIEALHELCFGELYGVEILEEGDHLLRLLSQAEQELIYFIRAGHQYIDILTVHNGQPILAEVDFKIRGFRVRRRVRFADNPARPTK